MRLFTAALPPPAVADHLAAALDGITGVDYWAPRAAWHITIGYYGEEDPGPRVEWVKERLPGLTPARISLGDSGNFRDTLLMTVSTSDSALAGMAAVLKWNDKHPEFVPHLTIGKGKPLNLAYQGPEWTVDEIVLLGAEERHDYTEVARFPLQAR
ncbi:2'-5' RNA ligase family protein [Actinocrispum wychmicini]|uniref:2'-5' RNA ligase n=1 Tax=Actinocrispum wychmicini TaxID=1213861 RepID=A0A4R2JRD8_9PSEU|nr:2'-5' RNA ligase family protein [Actinocrispum wychmicini]TCO56745.1 2'-5' RNA ligase [Actinocrispum wychmicini]